MEELMARTRAERKILKMMSSVIGTGTCGDDTGTPNVKRGDEKSWVTVEVSDYWLPNVDAKQNSDKKQNSYQFG